MYSDRSRIKISCGGNFFIQISWKWGKCSGVHASFIRWLLRNRGARAFSFIFDNGSYVNQVQTVHRREEVICRQTKVFLYRNTLRQTHRKRWMLKDISYKNYHCDIMSKNCLSIKQVLRVSYITQIYTANHATFPVQIYDAIT